MYIGRDGPAVLVASVQLEIDQQIAFCPAQSLGRVTGRTIELTMSIIHIHPIVGHIPVVVAMRRNLDVVPRLCCPVLGLPAIF